MRKPKLKRLHKHHTIGFDSLEKVNWHLANLWDGGYHTIIELTPKQHRKHHSDKAKRKRKLNRDLTTVNKVDKLLSQVANETSELEIGITRAM